jgi:hypothetical protein
MARVVWNLCSVLAYLVQFAQKRRSDKRNALLADTIYFVYITGCITNA